VPELARHDWAAVLDDLTVRVITRGDLLAVLGGLLEHRHPTRLGHVLAATSLRPSAARVLDEALRIAEATGAAVTALHVRPARMGAHGPEGATAAAVVKVERVRRHIADPVDAVGRREQRVHDVQGEVGEGPVAREIVRRAEELDSDLIVMGAAGARGRFLGLLEPLATLLDEDAPGDDAGEPTPGRPSPLGRQHRLHRSPRARARPGGSEKPMRNANVGFPSGAPVSAASVAAACGGRPSMRSRSTISTGWLMGCAASQRLVARRRSRCHRRPARRAIPRS